MIKTTFKKQLLAGSVLGGGAIVVAALAFSPAIAAQPTITFDQAGDIALESAPGTLQEIELDSENGRQVWEVEIKTLEGESEITLDAETGDVLAESFEDDDDDHEDHDDDDDDDDGDADDDDGEDDD